MATRTRTGDTLTEGYLLVNEEDERPSWIVTTTTRSSASTNTEFLPFRVLAQLLGLAASVVRPSSLAAVRGACHR